MLSVDVPNSMNTGALMAKEAKANVMELMPASGQHDSMGQFISQPMQPSVPAMRCRSLPKSSRLPRI